MSYDEMAKYIEHLRSNSDVLDVRIAWESIKTEQVTAFSSGRRMGLQIADAVASSFYYAVNQTRHGFTEDRYAYMLKSVVYQRNGQYLGYGIKLWPREVDDRVAKDENLGWILRGYK